MRHLKSFLLSLVLAPAIWALTGVGLAVHRDPGARLAAAIDTRLLGLAALGGAGVLVAVLAVGRLSPVGPAVAGLAFLAAAGYAPAVPGLVPELPKGMDEALLRPTEGYAVLIGVPLLATALSAQRWRRPAAAPGDYAALENDAALADYAAPMNPATALPADPTSPGPTHPTSPPPPAFPPIPVTFEFAPPADATRTARSPADVATEDLTGALLPLRATAPPAG